MCGRCGRRLGARAVQVVWSSRQGFSADRASRLGARRGRGRGVEGGRGRSGSWQARANSTWVWTPGARSGPLPIVGSKAGHLWDALCRAYDSLGFDEATGGDEVFRVLVLARIIEPNIEAGRAAGAGGERDRYGLVSDADPPPAPLRETLVAQGNLGCMRCARRCSGRPAWCCMTCRTLYFETDQGDGFREPGFSKERRLEPQITIGC